MLATWWKAHKWPVIPAVTLPATGVVIYSDKDVPVCAGFLYTTDSVLGILEWVVSNPAFDEKPARSEAVDLLIEELLWRAKHRGIKAIYSFVKNERLMKRYVDAGFTVTDTGMTHVLWTGGF